MLEDYECVQYLIAKNISRKKIWTCIVFICMWCMWNAVSYTLKNITPSEINFVWSTCSIEYVHVSIVCRRLFIRLVKCLKILTILKKIHRLFNCYWIHNVEYILTLWFPERQITYRHLSVKSPRVRRYVSFSSSLPLFTLHP